MELDAAQPGALSPRCPERVLVALQGALGLKGSEGPPGPPGPAVSAAGRHRHFVRPLPPSLGGQADRAAPRARRACPPTLARCGSWAGHVEEAGSGPRAGSRGDHERGARCVRTGRELGSVEGGPRVSILPLEEQGRC